MQKYLLKYLVAKEDRILFWDSVSALLCYKVITIDEVKDRKRYFLDLFVGLKDLGPWYRVTDLIKAEVISSKEMIPFKNNLFQSLKFHGKEHSEDQLNSLLDELRELNVLGTDDVQEAKKLID